MSATGVKSCKGTLLTRVRRDVFPEPLGPIKSIEGNVVKPLARKTTEWRKRGIVMARRIAIASPNGDGLRRVCTQSWMVDMTAFGDLDLIVPKAVKK
jgi:hypothetical protein